MDVPTDEQVDAFISVWIEHGELPWPWADVHDYLHDGVQGEERDQAIAAMKAEDQRQEAANREFVRRALRAAFDVRRLRMVNKTPNGTCTRDDCDLPTVDDDVCWWCRNADAGTCLADVTHRCPPDGSGTMPCCGRTPFEVSRRDRMTVHDDLVTCTR